MCRLDEAGQVCLSCFRAIDDIVGWSSYSEEQKQRAIERAAARQRDAISSGA